MSNIFMDEKALEVMEDKCNASSDSLRIISKALCKVYTDLMPLMTEEQKRVFLKEVEAYRARASEVAGCIRVVREHRTRFEERKRTQVSG